MKRIKLLQLITELERGGAEILLLELVKALPEKNFDIKVGYLRGQGTLVKEFKTNKIDITFFNIRSRFDIIGIFKLIFFLKKHCFDIVHTHLIDADIFGYIAAKIAQVPVIVSTKHNTDTFRKKKLPAVWLDTFLANNSTKVIAVSAAVKDFLIKFQKINPNNIEIIYNGVDLKKINRTIDIKQAKTALRINPEDYVIGCIARFDEQKGHRYLVQAINKVLAKIKNVFFVFVGTGRLESKIKERINQLNLNDKVKFLGQRDDINNILSALDVFVLPSVWEGLGIVLLEAQAAYLPVVATKVDGIAEVVKDGVTGLLVPAKDAQSLAAAIINLIEDNDKAQQYGKNGHEFVAQNFTIEKMANKIETLYYNLTG